MSSNNSINDNSISDSVQRDSSQVSNNNSNYSQLTDEELCVLSQNVNEYATETLIRRYYVQVSIISRNYFLIGGTGDDLEQEGLIGLLSAIRNYRPGISSFRTFALLCIKRNIIDAIRKSRNKNNQFYNDLLNLDELDDLSSQTYHLMEQDPEAQVIGKDDRTHIEMQLLNKLSDFEQHVLTLYISGLSYSEIAYKLSKPVKAVDNAVQRIRRKFQKDPDGN